MPIKVFPAIFLFLTIFSPFSAHATKCFKAKTLNELKEDFPVIIRGKILERKKIDERSFSLVIEVVDILKGKTSKKYFETTEFHFKKSFWKIYKAGNEYTFVAEVDGKTGTAKIILPDDGCPDLPAN